MYRLTQTILMGACLATLYAAPASAAITPLSPELQASLDAIRPDPRPKELIKGTHYVISNEPQQHLFREAIKDSGGIYVGVGAEQNYLLMGWSRPEVAIFVDFDDVIPRVHHIYASMLRRLDTPQALLTCWNADPKAKDSGECSYETVVGWLAEDYEGDLLKGVKNVWKFSRPRIAPHLHELRDHFTKLKIPCFLNDQETYTFVAEMVRARRVRAVRGDFTKRRTMTDIAAFARKACLPIRTLYLSNVDDYLNYYQAQHRKNMVGLPGDERSLVVQTEPSGGHTYHYLVQPLSVYREWLQCRCVYAISVIRPHRVPLGDEGLQTVKLIPSQVDKYKKKAKKNGPAPSFALPETCAR
ncbi:MAG: hypothetical protein ACPGU1_21640 [Myxococcota bacterium]